MHPRFTAAFSALPADLQTAIQPLLDSADFDGVLRPQDVARLKQETGLDEDALALALLPIAACCAVAPVSHFNVGAISRGVSGHWYLNTRRCSKPCMRSKAPLLMPGCTAKRSLMRLPSTTRLAVTAASL